MNGISSIKNLNVLQTIYLTCGLACLLCAVMLLSPIGQKLEGYFEGQALNQNNQTYLDDLVKKDRSELLLLSEINGFLSLIQSSELGVSFLVDAKIQVGNTLNPLTDITQQSFNSTLSSLHLTNGLQKALLLVKWLIPKITICVLILMGGYCLIKVTGQYSQLSSQLKSIIMNLSILLITLHLLVPYSLYASSKIDKSLYHSISEDVKGDLKKLHQTLVTDKHKNGLIERTEYFIKNLERMLLDIPKKTEALISYHSNQIVLTVLRIIAMPSLILLLLFLFTRFYIKKLFQTKYSSIAH